MEQGTMKSFDDAKGIRYSYQASIHRGHPIHIDCQYDSHQIFGQGVPELAS